MLLLTTAKYLFYNKYKQIKVYNDQKNVSVSVDVTAIDITEWAFGKSYSGDVPVAFPETFILPIVLKLKCTRSRQYRSDQI